ncbi:MAG: HAMP domain-containing protein [Woeseiaceae bacterium]|nr:HAMP domain-containing protein [Woeseiaceae bacterium]
MPVLAFGSPFPFEALLATGRSRPEPARAVVSISDTAMQLVVAPVRAPDLVGWVAVGFAIDDVLAHRIQGLTNLQVSFVEVRRNDTRVLASTLAEGDRSGLASATTLADVVTEPRVIELGGQPMLGLRHHLSTGPDYNLDVVLGLPMDEVLAGYAPLRMKLIGIMILALALSAFGARLLARTVSQPLKGLAEAARRISRGNYRETVAVGSDDEIGTLAQAFNSMQQGIRNREEQIVFQSQHDALTGLPNRTLVNEPVQPSRSGAAARHAAAL